MSTAGIQRPQTAPAARPAPVSPPAPRTPARRNRDVLGLVWLHGSFQAAVFRRQAQTAEWAAAEAVETIADFETALDDALGALQFGGTEVFLILEHEFFLHQTELAPAFSESAARSYLRGRVQRHETGRETMLWVSQRTASARKESAWLLHLLPATFYMRLNGLLRTRQLDLTRILPLSVPLQLLLDKNPAASSQPIMVATQAGTATTLMVGQAGSPLYFSRTMQARWETDPVRIAVEINRSLLYAKQQFGTAVNRLCLLGEGLEPACAEILARCGTEKEITVHATGPRDWLQAVARLSSSHPVNLVAGYINRKRRLQFFRRFLVGACWLGLALATLEAWARSVSWSSEHARLEGLTASEPTLLAERDRLTERNATAERHREFIRQAAETRLAPVPAQFLALIGGTLPPEISLTDFSARWDDATAGWTFRLEGQIAAEEETARELLTAWQKQLSRSPLRARFPDGARAIVPVPVPGEGIPTSHRFSVEGGLLEK